MPPALLVWHAKRIGGTQTEMIPINVFWPLIWGTKKGKNAVNRVIVFFLKKSGSGFFLLGYPWA